MLQFTLLRCDHELLENTACIFGQKAIRRHFPEVYIFKSKDAKGNKINVLPKKPFMFLSGLWDRFARLFNGLLPLIKRKLEVYTSEDVIISTKIQEQLGYQPKVTVEEAISRMASVYQRK